MAIFENDENERLAAANRLVHKKTNALGAQRNIIEEPFYAARTVTQNQVFSTEPTADANLAAPDYDDVDFQDGEVGSRYGISAGVVTPIALHSYTTSGLVGAESAQTFFAVTAPPVDNGIPALEDKRIYPLIGPEFSPLRATAAEAAGAVRGFELALYPAKTTSGIGTALEADTSNGPIPASADPGGISGTDDGGYWSVDYDSGVVRLSRAMLHGSTGVFNPNEVYADLAGLEQTTGAPMLFAVYYKYTGNVGFAQDQNFVTVGDGYVSFGSFTGVSANTMQSAIDSLPDIGGTVYVKEGAYDYVVPVNLRGGVRVLGLGGVKITRPRTEPAFVIGEDTRGVVDGYQVLDSIEVYPRDGVNSGGAVELRSNAASQDNRQVTISNNVLYAEDDAPAITFGPEHNCSYIGLTIRENTFKSGSTSPVYIGERDRGGNVVATDMRLTGNDFQLSDTSTSTALSITGSVVTDLDGLLLNKNSMPSSDVSIATGTQIERARVSNNDMSGLVISDDLAASIVSNNIMSSAVSLAALYNVTISGNTGFETAFTFDVTGAVSELVFSGNNIERSVTFSSSVTNANFAGNQFSWHLVFGSTISQSSFSSNYVDGNTTVASQITHTVICGNMFNVAFTSTGLFIQSVFSGNKVTSAASFGGTLQAAISSNYFDNTLTIDRGATDSALDSSVLSNNKVDGTTLIGTTITGASDYAMRDSVISGNTFATLTCGKSGRTASLISHLNSSITGNSTGAVSMHGQMEKTAFTGNKTSSAVFADIYKSTVSGNSFTSSFASEFVELSVIDGNYIASTTAIGGALNTSITGNSFGNNITITQSATTNALESSVFSDNSMAAGTVKFGDTITGVTTGNALKDSVVSGNSLVTFTCGNAGRNAGAETYVNSIIVGNITTGAAILYGKTQDMAILGNIFQDALTTGKIEASGVSSNRVFGAVNISGLYSSTITDGYFGDSLDIDSGASSDAIFSSVFSGNQVDGGTTFGGSVTGATANYALRDSMVSGNKFASFTAASAGRAGLTDTYINTIFNENIIDGPTLLYGAIQDSIVSQNTVTSLGMDSAAYSSISDNICFNAVTFSSNINNSSFSGNTLKSSMVVTGNTVLSILNSNYFDSVVTFTGFLSYAIVNSNIFGNAAGDVVNFTGGLYQTEVMANYFSASMTSGVCTSSRVNNNRFEINVAIDAGPSASAVVSSEFSNNYASDVTFGSSITGSTSSVYVLSSSNVTGNTVNSITGGALARSVSELTYLASMVSSNTVAGAITLRGQLFSSNVVQNNAALILAADAASSIISQNNVGGITVGVMDSSKVDDNAVFGDISAGAMSNYSSVSGNSVVGDMSLSSTVSRSIISDNTIDVAMTITGTITDSIISDNNVSQGNLTTSSVVRSILLGNRAYLNSTGISITGHLDASDESGPVLELIPNTVRGALSITPQAAPSDAPTVGDGYVSSTGDKLKLYSAGGWEHYVPQVFSLTDISIDRLTGSGAFGPSSFVNTAGEIQYALPSNSISVGSTIRVRASGTYGTSATAGTRTGEIFIAIDGTRPLARLPFSLSAVSSSFAWVMDGVLTSTGSSGGSTFSSGTMTLLDTSSSPTSYAHAQFISVDFSSAQVINVHLTMTAGASASDTLFLKSLVIDIT